MENNVNEAQAISVNEDIISPDGWDGNSDFFEWAEANPVDALGAKDTNLTENSGSNSDGTPTTGNPTEGNEEQQSSEDVQPTTPNEPGKTAKLKFTAKINHRNVDVEMDEAELPSLYQSAKALDRYKKRLSDKEAEMEQAEVVASLLGYENISEMLEAAAKSYEDNEIDRLVSEKLHPDAAKDMVQRKIADIKETVSKKRKTAEPKDSSGVEESVQPETNDGKRDFSPEVAELLAVYPEYHGKELPKEVVDDCLQNNKPLVQAVTDYKSRQREAELNKLRKENQNLKQNAETARRAPVKGVVNGGATNETSGDPFLDGFNSL